MGEDHADDLESALDQIRDILGDLEERVLSDGIRAQLSLRGCGSPELPDSVILLCT